MPEVDEGTVAGASEVVVLVGLLEVSDVDVLVSVVDVGVSSCASATGAAAKVASAAAETTPATRFSVLPTTTPNGG
ncbi:hypothetical protein QRX60_11175 [Amycolatopsis mongoliensis]|uniref:Uncharacterized protein n=1 Tax=Amycolatopsis mongoliensis TaxID=715475 RepID=A0A9Y2JVE0_9PSEU|nr:hypothetical protein [Amycolatopsis sp. 4-36]WIY04371.1 hypothetical protein QRX60_11175 [Amycolatopsis sp. 4-36]